jgi:NAD-dependent deacetylase sirtuin 2
LPYPEAIFEYDYFLENPKPFFMRVKGLYPYPEGKFVPTAAHHFIKLLEDKGILLRHYTQNIDGLDEAAGVSSEKLVCAHGSLKTAHCVKCNKEHDSKWMGKQIFESKKDKIPLCTGCGQIVKPDVVFFGPCSISFIISLYIRSHAQILF